MKPVPKLRQQETPGVRLVSGRLLNQIAEAIRARTPLNTAHNTARGYAGATNQGGTPVARAQVVARFDDTRVYVVPGGTLRRLAEDLRARMPSGQTGRNAPAAQATAASLDALIRSVEGITPAAFDASSPAGFRLPATTSRTGSMTIEREDKLVWADLCALGVSLSNEWYVVKQTTVNVFANGTKTATSTAGGNVRTWQSGSPTACAAAVNENDTVPGKDYGAFVSSDYYENTEAFSTVLAAAVAALGGAATTTTTTNRTWPEADWQAVTSGTWSPVTLGNSGVAKNALGTPGLMQAVTSRWRITNTGQCHIKVTWERRLSSNNSLVTSDTLNLSRGETSAWQSLPTASASPAAKVYVTLSAVQLGPYR